MAERKLEDLKLTDAQRRAIATGKQVIEEVRRQDEAAARLLASTNPPFKPKGWIWWWVNRFLRWMRIK